MKSEQRKKEDRELIYDLLSFFDSIESYTFNDVKTNFDFFIKDRSLEAKPKLELNRWIVDSASPEWLWFYGDNIQYGIDSLGEWRNTSVRCITPLCLPTERYATDDEILERLSKIAVKMGYKERQSECLTISDIRCDIILEHAFFYYDSYGLWIINKVDGSSNLIFKDGKWAKFIETDTERIERLEKRVKELENKNK